MPASQSAAARHLAAPVRQYQNYEAALDAIAGYETALRENAGGRRARGLTVTDQDQPEEVFCLFPPRPLSPPLLIIGGMGPLAGAQAFRQACARFRDSRAVVLYQACSMPDRSRIIAGSDTTACQEMASRLTRAIRFTIGLTDPVRGPARCIIACNSAHYFWPLLDDKLRQTPSAWNCQVRMISLVDSTVETLRRQSCKNTLVLTTEGARAGHVFSRPFRDAGIPFEEPSSTLSPLLTRAIFEGVKALDDSRAVRLGNRFFEAILRGGQEYDCVLAGCTELPLIITLLQLRGSPKVTAFLSGVKIVNPLEEALRRS